jgi:hypothetical protein
MMKRNLYLGLLVFGIALLALAVAAPNFSGAWIRDKAKSDPMGMGRPGGGGGGGQAPDVEVTLTIKQDANSFETSTQRGDRPPRETKYTLDGKENTTTTQRGSTVSKSKWNGDVLVIEGVQKFTNQAGDAMEMKFKDEYSLSADGKVLTVTNTSSGPQGERTSKQVYNKK